MPADSPTAALQRDLHRAILTSLRFPLQQGARVLDFGCGEGEAVRAYASLDYDAWGCDIELGDGASARLRLIEEPYRLPFADESFDFVFSDQVFEHVQDIDAAVSEIARVLKPGAPSLHVFPGRWRPIEPHVFVPLATVMRALPWLRLWASVGVRNRFQRGMSAEEVAKINSRYLEAHTFYRSHREIEVSFGAAFDRVEFCEAAVLAHSYGRARHVAKLRQVPGFSRAFSGFHTRAILAVTNAHQRHVTPPAA